MTIFDYSKLFTELIFILSTYSGFPKIIKPSTLKITMILGLSLSDFRKNTHELTLIYVKLKIFGITAYSQKCASHSRSALMHPYITPLSSAQVSSYYYWLMKPNYNIPFGKLMYNFVFNFLSRNDDPTSTNPHIQFIPKNRE